MSTKTWATELRVRPVELATTCYGRSTPRTCSDVEDRTLHNVRHTAASLLLAQSGAELAELAELKFVLGHSQISHTVDLYGHLVPGRLEGLRTTFECREHSQATDTHQKPYIVAKYGTYRSLCQEFWLRA